jgi:hypothetical protein
MRRLLTLVFLAAVAVPAAAQETPRPSRPPRDTTLTRTYRLDVGPEGVVYQYRRGRLGVVVDLSADAARDSIGARITGVTPGGAADKAGVRTGDVVVRFNDTRLAGADRGGEEEEDASLPGRRLVEMASRLHTGDTVRLELRRDRRPVSVTVVAGESGMEGMVRGMTLQPSRRPLVVEPFGEGPRINGQSMTLMFDRAPFANLELVKMNPGLGEYFGTAEGILVVSAPGDSALGLRAGDVILSIGGRKPTGPSHAFRILGTYDPGETVNFELMRAKRHVNISGKMPDRSGWRAMPNSFEDFDELLQPGWEGNSMDLLRGWTGIELPKLWSPELQPLKTPQLRTKTISARHRAVST